MNRRTIIPAFLMLLAGCSKMYDLPEDRDYLSDNATYTATRFTAVLGRTTLLGNFSADNSNLPLTFEIKNARNADGTTTEAFTQRAVVDVWKEPYNGLETSLAAIHAKRKQEERPVFEVLKSGEFVLWNTAVNNNFLKSGNDSTYFFDVQVSNGGGSKTVRRLELVPLRERPYEPSTHIDPFSGLPLFELNGQEKRLLPNLLSGMRGASSNRTLVREENANLATVRQDCWVYFKRKGDGNSLSFKFMDKDSLPIDPARFNGTKWNTLLHGFNMQLLPDAVRYEVAYPIPLTRIPTQYTTTDGLQANVVFSYNRIGFSGQRETGNLGLSFNIWQPGDWEIIFFFHNETPKFDNE